MGSSQKAPSDRPLSMLGTLPPEVWYRVFTYLDPQSLSSVCKVNSAFHKVATEESLFRRHLAPHLKGPHAAQIYRRFTALYYPTTTKVSIHSCLRTELFAIVHDTLLFIDFERSRFVTFPSGLIIPADASSSPWDYLTFPDKQMSFVVLPEHHVGFMYDRSPTMFAVMNVINGDLWTYPVPEDRFPKRPVCFGKPFLPAGNNAEWVAYYANDTKLVLFDWRSGEVHQEIETSRTVRYVMAECPLIDANCLVGFVHVREKGPEKTAVMKCFDGEDDAFSIDSDSKLFMLLRSADKQTYVLITSSGPGYGEGMYFQVRRNTKGEPKCWGGELDMPGYPEIRDNGSVLACRCEPYPHSQFVCTELWGWQLWIEIDNAASSKVARIPLFITPEALVWTQRTKDSGLAVFAESGCFLVLTKYCNDGGSFTPVQLRRWFVNDMISVHVVADHYIVVQSRDGKITIIHFDWFCEGATGVYACPGFVEEETDEFSGSGMDLIY